MKPLHRLLPLFRFVPPVVLMAAVVNAALLAADVLTDDWIETANVARDTNRVALRVRGAEKAFRSGGLAPDRPLVAIYGFSTIGDGIDLEMLDREDGVDVRYLHLASGGLELSLFASRIEPLLNSRLQPDLVILGIHPFVMVEPRQIRIEGEDGPAPDVAGEVSRQIWIVRHREGLANLADDLLMNVRRRLEDAQNPDEDPWGQVWPLRSTPGGEYPSERGLQAWNRLFETNGKYNLDYYMQDRAGSTQRLVEIITRLHGGGSKVVVLLMPDRNSVRDQVPVEAKTWLLEDLRARFPETSLPILDFSELLPDSGFRDIAHANEYGRETLSRSLAREIPRLLEDPA
jgi:hypothetical protein